MPNPKSGEGSRHTEAATYAAPPTASAPSLLRGSSDRAFQDLVFNLFTISARIEQVRSHLASRMRISGPQYSLLRAVASLQGEEGISVGTLADHLNVTSTFITVQSRLLARRGFLKKRQQTTDRRVSLLSLTAKGERLVTEVVNEVRPINDIFFGTLDRNEFDALSAIAQKLVHSSREAIVRISSQNQHASMSIRDNRRAGR